MNFPFYIAKRYLFSKKSHNAINIISWISISGIAFGTMALVIILSAFNGLENLVEDLYATFDPDIKITIKEGKTFKENEFPRQKILLINGIEHYTVALEEVALIKYKDKQTVATIKGVESEFIVMTGLDSMIIRGDANLVNNNKNQAILGYGIADKLALNVSKSMVNHLSIIVPKRGVKKSLLPSSEFNRSFINPTGIFSISPDFDTKYILVPLAFNQKLLNHNSSISSIEIGVHDKKQTNSIKEQIKTLIGSKYDVKTRYELNELIYKTNKTEKWITFLILAFVLVIASFNIIGSLTMLIIDKQKDIWILKTLGASNQDIRKIFFTEGMLINLFGAFIGMLIGAIVCWLQITFGLLKLNGGVVDFYPVSVEGLDFVYTTIIVIIIGLIASWFPVRVITRRHL